MEKNFGFTPSKMDGSEHVFGANINGKKWPDSYSYREFLPQVINQGEYSICVPCSISAFLNWRENLKDGSSKDNRIDYFEVYNCKTNDGEGMSFKEAFSFIRHQGVESKAGKLKINEYALVNNPILLKQAIVLNGPCVGAFPVFNDSSEFWKQRKGDYLVGYHAISIVGYDDEGFIIRNSWGKSFGNQGYTKMKYEDYGKLIEVWTIID